MEHALQLIRQLANDFSANEQAFLSSTYSESKVRQDFVDKFFTALGWDVTHAVQKNPYEQEVKIENPVHMAGSQRRADYAFSIAPNYDQVKFFVEAKKPSRTLANADDYFQTIRYAWNTRIPIAVLTDFEEFHILDCRYKPNIKTALQRKIAQYRYTEYADPDVFAKIFHLFGREAVASGSLERFATTLPKKGAKTVGGVQLVDDAFLEELDNYREILAKAFKKTNESLQGDELTEAVQRTIDRLVFIRFLEDKGIEDNQIVTLNNPSTAWKSFSNLCKRFEPKYNGLVFKQHRILDTGEFHAPDGNAVAGIFQKISDPSSPYDFNQIPVSILGSIYERFLGKVVHATEKRVKVEEKPEVRKAGGVYYTPEYIVKYIVKETVGKLLYNDASQVPNGDSHPERAPQLLSGEPKDAVTGKTPAEIANMAFADIACGSGSFLIEVYQQLLDYHLKYYIEHPEAVGKDVLFERNGQQYLTLKKKKEILVNNVYGVDIDFQATEVTQLSLYLKMLENATMSEAHQFGMFKETILPDLRQNIICGNSLIGRDILEGELFSTIDESKLKPMDFEIAFPKIMKRGGFNAVVGNPPYVRQENIRDQKPYFENVYKTFNGVADIYVYFIEKGINILKKNGKFGIIVANKWLRANYGMQLRNWLKKYQIEEIIDFGDLPVFQNAITYPCILRIVKTDFTSYCSIGIPNTLDFSDLSQYIGNISRRENINLFPVDESWTLMDSTTSSILKKIKNNSVDLGDIVDQKIFRGVTTGFNDAFIIDSKTRNTLINEDKNSSEVIKPFVTGSEVKRYDSLKGQKFIIFAKRGINIKNYPSIEKHLLKYKSKLVPKPKNWKGKEWEGRKPGAYKWFEIQDSTEYYLEFEKPKIMFPDISLRGNFTIDRAGTYYVANTGYIIGSDSKYLLGILNSKLITFYYQNITSTIRGGYLRFIQQYVKQIPIKSIQNDNFSGKVLHDRIATLATQLLDAKHNLNSATIENEINRLELLCASLDSKIDEAVYELYGLTEDEIKIIEGVEGRQADIS